MPLSFGCSKTVEDTPELMLEQGDEAVDYSLVECVYGDVEEKITVKCEYKKHGEQEVYFPVSGKLIDRVYVKEGDSVSAGDVLVELSVGDLESRIKDLEYSIARNRLLLGYLDEQQKLDEDSRYYNLVLTGQVDEDRKEEYDEQLERSRKQYEQRRNGYRDSIEFDEAKLRNLKAELSSSRVYAKFNGKVSKVTDRLAGSTSNKEKCIMTIVDDEEGYFEASSKDAEGYFHEGEAVYMKVISGKGKGEYELLPLNMDNWGDSMYFSILSGDSAESLDAGVKGDITVVTQSKKNVLCLPSECIHPAGDDSYVYILNENGQREAAWIVTGISGGGVTEIVSGLKEGDKVIRR